MFDVTKQKKQNFLQGASILMVSMIIVKLVGAVFKIPLGNILQETGYAYFTASYSLFTTIYALTVTGLSTAIARMVAACSTKKRYRDCRNILHISIKLFVILGIVGTLAMILCSKLFAHASNADDAVWAIIFMAPAVFFSCMMAAYRGYYEGLRNMIPTAISEIVEVITKMITGLLFAYLFLLWGEHQYEQTGKVFGFAVKSSIEGSQPSTTDVIEAILPFAAAGAMLGIALSTLFGFLYLYIAYKRSGDGFTKVDLMNSPKPIKSKSIMNTLLKTALPITLSSVVINLTGMIDLFSVMNRLEYAYQQNSAYFMNTYGDFTRGKEIHTYIYGGFGMAVTIFNLVPAFTALFAKSALPNLTAAWVQYDKGRLKTSIESVLRMTSVIAFPAGIGIFVMADPISLLLYGKRPGVLVSVAPPLRLLGLAAIFLALVSPLYSIFQAVGRFDLPVKFMLVGAVLKLTINFILVGIPEINIKGAPIGTGICYFVIMLLCLITLKKIIDIKFCFLKVFGGVFLASLLCGATAFLINQLSDEKIVTVCAIAGAGVVYVIGLLLFRALPESDVKMLPKGDKLAALMKKLHLLAPSEVETK